MMRQVHVASKETGPSTAQARHMVEQSRAGSRQLHCLNPRLDTTEVDKAIAMNVVQIQDAPVLTNTWFSVR